VAEGFCELFQRHNVFNGTPTTVYKELTKTLEVINKMHCPSPSIFVYKDIKASISLYKSSINQLGHQLAQRIPIPHAN
jgi:hypothetical protein